MSPCRALLVLGSTLALCACKPANDPIAGDAVAQAPAPAATVSAAALPQTQLAASARAALSAVGDSGVGGELAFDVDDGGVRVTGTLTGLEPGSTHGFHLHEVGDCSAADASSAGGHFNPTQQPHGDRQAGGAHHAGDIPNQVAGDDGQARVDQRLADLEIGSGGDRDIVGKSVIVHAKADDYRTQPSGDSGDRLACGVIELANAPPTGGGPAD
jgi:Cu-Zn family superoxide dismutase